MKIDKVNGQYDTYKMEVSLGELKVLLSRLETDHAEPVADEMHAAIRWYLDNLPAPGEDKEEFKQRQDHETELNDPEKSGAGHDDSDELGNLGALDEPSDLLGDGLEDGGSEEPPALSTLDDVGGKTADDFVPAPPTDDE